MGDSDDDLQSSFDFDDVDNTEDLDEVDAVEPDSSDEDQDSESDTDSDAGHEAKNGKKKGPDAKIEERIGELTRKRHEAERRAEQRERELAELQAKILESQEPVIPELPDRDEVGEDEFREAVRRRDKAIQEKVAWTQQKTQFEQQRKQGDEAKQLETQTKLLTAAEEYTKRATALKIKPDELAKCAQVMKQVGISDDISMHILEDDLGPAITKYLGNNIADLLEVANSNPIRAALYIEQKIKPKLKPASRKSNAPPPPGRKKGGVPDAKRDKYPLSSGRVKFE